MNKKSIVLALAALVIGVTNAEARSQNPQEICSSLIIEGGTERERASVCDAISFIMEKLEPYGVKYNWDQPIAKIQFHEKLDMPVILGFPDLKELLTQEEIDGVYGVNVGLYFPETREIHMLDFANFKKYEKPGKFTIDYKVWEAMLPYHEISHYFIDMNNNDVAMLFFEEALAYWMEISHMGIERAKEVKLYNPIAYDHTFMTEEHYKLAPFSFSILSWEVINGRPDYYIPGILNGDINLDYINYVRKRAE